MARLLMVLFIFATLIAGTKACPDIIGCKFLNSDCTSISCSTTFLGKPIGLKVKLSTCGDDVTAKIKVTAVGVTFQHTFSADEEIPIPGLAFGPLGSANIGVKVTREGQNLRLEVDLIIKVLSSTTNRIKIIDEKLGKAGDCDVTAWFAGQSIAVKIAIIGGSILVLLVAVCCLCCCCCCKKRRKPVILVTGQATEPNNVSMTTVPKSSEPYHKF